MGGMGSFLCWRKRSKQPMSSGESQDPLPQGEVVALNSQLQVFAKPLPVAMDPGSALAPFAGPGRRMRDAEREGAYSGGSTASSYSFLKRAISSAAGMMPSTLPMP